MKDIVHIIGAASLAHAIAQQNKDIVVVEEGRGIQINALPIKNYRTPDLIEPYVAKYKDKQKKVRRKPTNLTPPKKKRKPRK